MKTDPKADTQGATMHPHDKGWHEVNWAPLEEPEPQYDDDAVATVLMTIICIGVIATYFWDLIVRMAA